MISEHEVNLWLMSNNLCVLRIADYHNLIKNLTELRSRGQAVDEVHIRQAREQAAEDCRTCKVSATSEAEVRKLKKKLRPLSAKLRRLKRQLERLKTGELKRLLSLLAKSNGLNNVSRPLTR
jgi:predicted RNase H-like nuclease (RuvC/YqgF family)